MLKCSELNARYGAAHVLFDVDLELPEGRVLSLLGRNGVGKSTLLKTIMGLVPAYSGAISFRGQRIEREPPYRVARLGLGYVPEDRRVFSDLSVEDNIEVAQRRGSLWTLSRLFEFFPALEEFRKRPAGLLSGGQQQMLTIARTLAGGPTLVLLDEPTEGLAPVMVKALEAVIGELKRQGQTMLIAAQDLRFALAIADEVLVMERGCIVLQVAGEVARSDSEQVRALFKL